MKILYRRDQVILKNSFRKEYKFQSDIDNSGKYLDWIKKNSSMLFPKRTVQSIYYDTLNFSLYKNSLFDDTDRFKIRFRNYRESPEEIYKEVKRNTRNGKYKTSEITKYKNLNELGTLYFEGVQYFPKSFVSYTREYYLSNNSRITYDRDIVYRSVDKNFNKFYKSKKVIIEFKLDDTQLLEENYISKNLLFSKHTSIEGKLFGNPEKFSKYVDSVEKLNLINEIY